MEDKIDLGHQIKQARIYFHEQCKEYEKAIIRSREKIEELILGKLQILLEKAKTNIPEGKAWCTIVVPDHLQINKEQMKIVFLKMIRLFDKQAIELSFTPVLSTEDVILSFKVVFQFRPSLDY